MIIEINDDLLKKFRLAVSRYLYASIDSDNMDSWEDFESSSDERAFLECISTSISVLNREAESEWMKTEKEVFGSSVEFSNPYIAEEMYHFVDDLDLWSDVSDKGCSVAEYVPMYARCEFASYLLDKGYSL